MKFRNSFFYSLSKSFSPCVVSFLYGNSQFILILKIEINLFFSLKKTRNFSRREKRVCRVSIKKTKKYESGIEKPTKSQKIVCPI